MKYIAHRGLFEGPDEDKENHPGQIQLALSKNYDCEVDVWFKNKQWWLGHNEPQYPVDKYFMGQQGLWIHCKNLDALYELSIAPFVYSYFWHQNDDFTLTSTQHIWTYPGKHLTNNSIAVVPEIDPEYWEYVKCLKIYGVCTDYVEKFINETSTMSFGSTEKL